MQMNIPLAFKYYFNEQMTTRVAVYGNIIYSTRLENQGMTSILFDSSGRE